jgi:hypothetical protein
MSRYAVDTSVSVEKSRAEIEHTLARYGATRFAYAAEPERAQVVFEASGRRVRFLVPLPAKDDKDYTHTPSRGTKRHPDDAFRAWEQACRQRWRALALAIKAKLEVVEAGISSFEQEFLAHIVLPNGETVGDWIEPQIETSYQTRKMPPLLVEDRRPHVRP